MKERIIGFDLARAYAIFGMFIVNFNFCFGNIRENTGFAWFLNLFTGNSTSIFILLAGMGVSLMSNRAAYNATEKANLKSTVEYFPAYPAFMLVTGGFALMVISSCMWIGERFSSNIFVQSLVKTGQMTLSHYVIHLTLGIFILTILTGKTYDGFAENETPTAPIYIFAYACLFFTFSVTFSVFWRKRFEKGPMEMLMRNYEF